MMNGVCRLDRASRGRVITASPAAMPSEPPMKSKSCTAIDDRLAFELAVADLARRRASPVLARASLRRSA